MATGTIKWRVLTKRCFFIHVFEMTVSITDLAWSRRLFFVRGPHKTEYKAGKAPSLLMTAVVHSKPSYATKTFLKKITTH